ncbi:MAG: hypothetical protein MI919_13435 [Holophagales bacterium]|nr:hypothetical protein [Holophagales bacterium]
MRRAVALLLAFFVVSAASGREVPAEAGEEFQVLGSTPVMIGQRVELRSKILGTEVSMNIALPGSFEVASPDHTYPVIFVHGSHGEQFFGTVAGIVRHLGERERIPESIVVSLNDIGAIPEVFTNGMWAAEKLGGSGDPQADLRHLEQEVIPYLERSFRANGFRMIVGVSGSSLFPIFTFTRAPEMFDSYLLVAAADVLGMGYEKGKTFIDAFEAAFEASPQRRTSLYLATAGRDLEKRSDYRANLDAARARLGRFEHLDLGVEVMPKADHYTVLIDALQYALAQRFPPERWSARYRELVAQPGDALANIDAYYRELSSHYEFEILPRANRWNNVNCLRFMIRHLIREGRTKEAVSVAERRVSYRPRVPAAHAGLADAFEANGQPAAAIEAQQKAVDLARASSSPDLEAFEARLKSLREPTP